MRLAQMAWSERDYAAAQDWAEQAVAVGAHRAKTISAWPLLLRARAAQGLPLPTWADLNGQLADVKPSIRARTVHKIVRAMRSAGKGDWKGVALGWWDSTAKREPRVAGDLAKILLADARLAHTPPADRITAARRVLGVPKITFKEWWSATREIITAQKQSGVPIDIGSHYRAGLAKCLPAQVPWMRHSLGAALRRLGEAASIF